MSEQSRREHLIIQTAFVGDLLLGIPLLKELRRAHPEDKITLYCRLGLGDFLLSAGLIDEAVEVDKTSSDSLERALRRLQERKFDLLICPHQSTRSTLLARRLKARMKIGYGGFLNTLVFNRRVRRPMELPEALRQLALLQPLDAIWRERLDEFARAQALAGGRNADESLVAVPAWAEMTVGKLASLRADFRTRGDQSRLSVKSRRLLERVLNELSAESAVRPWRLAVLAPGSVWATKMWTPDGYAQAARELLAEGYKVLLIGAAAEKAACDGLATRAPGAVSIAGETSLYESAEILALADLVICNDSGAMHMAAAAAVPTVAVFGPTVLDFGYRPWQNNAAVAEVPSASLGCRPCGSHGARSCPIGTHICMHSVSAEQVLRSARALAEKR